MLALAVALAATIVLTEPVLAEPQYTVWSSVVLVRTGERTPLIDDFLPYELTSYGAQQSFNAGSFLRNRYITANDTSQENGAFLRHTGSGTWSISPRGEHDAPTTATVELYANGKRISTSTLHLRWPKVDPCSASNPPAPHPTVSAG